MFRNRAALSTSAALLTPLLFAAACRSSSGGTATAARTDPAFAEKWSALLATGARPLLVGDQPTGGEALLDSVHRTARKKAQIVRPPAPPAPPAAAALPAAAASDIVEAQLPGGNAVAPAPAAGSAPTAEAPATGTAPPEEAPATTLGDADLSRVIRAGLSGLKGCYRAAESTTSEGGGKAIVRFTILPSGAVDAVNVSAPSFEDSRLPGCVTTQVRLWRFPTFQGQPMEVTYPFVFAGS